jgi:hypothetical protein
MTACSSPSTNGVSSRRLNAMSESQLMAYSLIIIPGGNFIDIGNSLTPATMAGIHDAVQGGVNYLESVREDFLEG